MAQQLRPVSTVGPLPDQIKAVRAPDGSQLCSMLTYIRLVGCTEIILNGHKCPLSSLLYFKVVSGDR